MPEAQDTQQQQGQAPNAGDEFAVDELDALTTRIKDDPAKAAATIKRLRREAQQRRTEAEELAKMRAEQERIANERKQAEEAALKEQGKFKEIADKRESELSSLKAERDTLIRYKEAAETMLKARLEAIPEPLRKRVPDLGDTLKTLAWIDANADLFAARQAPNLDQATPRNGNVNEAAKAEARQATESLARSVF